MLERRVKSTLREVYFSNREKSKVKNECLYYVVIDNISFID